MFSKFELLFLEQTHSSSASSQLLILQFPIPRASLRFSPSFSSFTLANWNPSSTQSSSCSSVISLFCPTTFNQTTPQVLDIPNHTATQANQIYYQAVYRSSYLMSQVHNPSKSWVFKSHFSFKVTQHGQQQLYFQYKVCWTTLQVLLHFENPTSTYNNPYNLHEKSFPLLQSTFTSLFPCFLTKSSLQSTLRLPSCIPQHFFTSLFLCATIQTVYTKNVFPTSAIYPIQAASKDKETMESCKDF